MHMKRFLLLEVSKLLDGTYSTRVVFESEYFSDAYDECLRLSKVSSDFQLYRLKSITFPEL